MMNFAQLKKTALIQMRIDPGIKAKAEIADDEDSRSLSQWIVALIKAALKDRRTE